MEVVPDLSINIFKKAIKGSLEIGKRNIRQSCTRLNDRDRIDISAYHVGAQANRLVQGRASTHHRIQDNPTLQATRCIIVSQSWVNYKLFEDRAKCRATAPCPPLVQIRVGTKQMLVVDLQARQRIGEGLGKLPIDRQVLVNYR